jgi:tRNA threonylcarbamoyl adenosine modification protein (Sua5/YciO/YrdC/YwlC family)
MKDPLRLVIEARGEPAPRKIAQAVEILHGGGVCAYPTDSIYALGCAIESKDGIERIFRAKGMPKNHRLALICPDLSSAAHYGMFSQTAFRLAQRIFPGPFTLVVPATREVPKTLTDTKRRTVGIRITAHPIAAAITKALGRPLLTSSAISPITSEVCRDADEILETFGRHIDVLIDTESTNSEPSTVIEVTGDEIVVIRQGQGSLAGMVL